MKKLAHYIDLKWMNHKGENLQTSKSPGYEQRDRDEFACVFAIQDIASSLKGHQEHKSSSK